MCVRCTTEGLVFRENKKIGKTVRNDCDDVTWSVLHSTSNRVNFGFFMIEYVLFFKSDDFKSILILLDSCEHFLLYRKLIRYLYENYNLNIWILNNSNSNFIGLESTRIQYFIDEVIAKRTKFSLIPSIIAVGLSWLSCFFLKPDYKDRIIFYRPELLSAIIFDFWGIEFKVSKVWIYFHGLC